MKNAKTKTENPSINYTGHNLPIPDDPKQCCFVSNFLFKLGTIAMNNCMSFSMLTTYTDVSKDKILFWADDN